VLQMSTVVVTVTKMRGAGTAAPVERVLQRACQRACEGACERACITSPLPTGGICAAYYMISATRIFALKYFEVPGLPDTSCSLWALGGALLPPGQPLLDFTT
jgi:hypothetical protein